MVRFYGLADLELNEIVDWFQTVDDAHRAARGVVRDEPDWAGVIAVARVEFGYLDAEVEILAVY